MSPRIGGTSLLAAVVILAGTACSFDFAPTSPGSGSWYGNDLDASPPPPFHGCTAAHSYQIGSTVNGALTEADCVTADGRRLDRYDFILSDSATVTIDLYSSFDTYLWLFDADGRVIGQDDDGGEELNSRLTTYLEPGTYSIGASSYAVGVTGGYTLSSR